MFEGLRTTNALRTTCPMDALRPERLVRIAQCRSSEFEEADIRHTLSDVNAYKGHPHPRTCLHVMH